MTSVVCSIYPDYVLSPGVAVRSVGQPDPRNGKQCWHRDFPTDFPPPTHPPLSVILSLDEHAGLDIFNNSHPDLTLVQIDNPGPQGRTRVHWGFGVVLIFHGHTVHRGVGYSNDHIRIHFFAQHFSDPFPNDLGDEVEIIQ